MGRKISDFVYALLGEGAAGEAAGASEFAGWVWRGRARVDAWRVASRVFDWMAGVGPHVHLHACVSVFRNNTNPNHHVWNRWAWQQG